MGCNCKDGNIYQIGFGCCRPSIMPADDFYTKPQIDQMFDEIESAITSGCCITPEEVDDKIEAAKIDTEQWVENKGYLTEHQPIKTINGISLIGTGDVEIGTGGTVDLSNYYTTAETQSAITQAVSGKVDTSMFTAYTGAVDTILSGKADISYVDSSVSGKANTSDVITSISDNRMGSNYGINYTKNGTTTAKWIFTASSGLTVDGRNISVDPAVVAYKNDVTTLINQAVSGKQDTLSAGTNITIVDNVISATGGGSGTTYNAGRGINIDTANTISLNVPISAGTGTNSVIESNGTIAINNSEHASGQFNYSVSASTTFGDSGNTLFTVGNGTSDNDRHNAFEVRQNGDIYIKNGDAKVNLQAEINKKADSTTLNNYFLKSKIWCGTETEWGQISGSTDSETLYLIHD